MRTLVGLSTTLLFAAPLLGACGGSSGDGPVALGARQLSGYRIDPAAAVTLDQAGFGITAQGIGRFRLVWVGVQTDVLEGTLTSDGDFDPPSTSPLGGKELIANEAGQIQFRLSPTADLNGLDFVTSLGPVYLDLQRNADRAQASISFVQKGTRELSAFNPVAIDVSVIR